MKYFTTITSLVFLNIIAVITLLYFGNSSKIIEEKNNELNIEISKYKEQIRINEVEYNLYNSYSYLKKLQKIYFDTEPSDLSFLNRISFEEFIDKDLKNVYEISSN